MFKARWLWILLVLLVAASPAWAEVVHLTTGESIRGRITRADDQSISIESEQGFGVLQIPRNEITLIEFEESERDFSRRIGIGYVHRTTPFGVSAQVAEYAIDQISLKYWLNQDDSLDFNTGFYSSSDDDETLLEVFSFDLRYAHVFRRQANLDLYYGGSLGLLNVTDKTAGNDVDDSGSSIRVFLGSEIFFTALPNLGFSAEVGFGTQSIGDRETTNLSTTTFPTLSVRYYY